MTVLESILQACRRECETRRRYLSELEALAHRLRADAARVGKDAAEPPHRKTKLDASIASIAAQIAAATDALEAAKRELYRHEAARARRAAATPVRAARRLPHSVRDDG